MAESTFVKQVQTKSKAAQSAQQGLDWILVGVVAGLTLFGILMVYSAGPKFAMAIGESTDYFLVRQFIWASAGIAGAFVLSRIDYHRYARFAVLMIIVMLLSLITAVILRDRTLGANRSLFSGSVRPSELAKLVTIIYVSVWLTSKREVLNELFIGLFPLMLILGITGGFIMIQPDFSAALTVVVLGGILFFLAGGAWRQIAITLLVAMVFIWITVNLYPTGFRRVTEYIAGLNNPLNASYHVQRSIEAIINGGIFGVGIGHGSTKFTGLPVAPTDSIFAVIAEETGLIGTALVIAAYVVLLWRGLAIARRAPDMLGSLIASGVTLWIVFEAFLNMAVMVNLLPQAGNALPLISYGGSSLVTTLAGIGILFNIARVSSKTNLQQGGNTFNAVVDLRWRDRGRSVPRYGRTSGSGK